MQADTPGPACSYLEDKEPKQGCEVKLAKQRWQDTAIDLEVGLRDLHMAMRPCI